MISQEQRDLIYDSCSAVYEDKEDASIIAEATVIRIEGEMLTFQNFAEGILKRKGLQSKIRDRLHKALERKEASLKGRPLKVNEARLRDQR